MKATFFTERSWPLEADRPWAEVIDEAVTDLLNAGVTGGRFLVQADHLVHHHRTEATPSLQEQARARGQQRAERARLADTPPAWRRRGLIWVAHRDEQVAS